MEGPPPPPPASPQLFPCLHHDDDDEAPAARQEAMALCHFFGCCGNSGRPPADSSATTSVNDTRSHLYLCVCVRECVRARGQIIHSASRPIIYKWPQYAPHSFARLLRSYGDGPALRELLTNPPLSLINGDSSLTRI